MPVFSATSRAGTRLGLWKTTPMSWARSAASVEKLGQVTCPRVGSSRPAIRCRSVDLPDPDGPAIAIRAPGLTCAVVPWTATTAERPEPNVRDASVQTTRFSVGLI